MTETQAVAEKDIDFQGRTMRVRQPQPEQIMVWRRVMAQLETAQVRKWTGKEVMDALERVRKVIDSVLVNTVDVQWLDDEMMMGRLGLKEACEILLETVQAFTNRSGRRAAAKKTAPARRKAPTKKAAPAKKTTGRKSTS